MIIFLGGIDTADLFIKISGAFRQFSGQGKINLQNIGIQHSGIKTKIRITLFDKRVDACLAAVALVHDLAVQIASVGQLFQGLMGFSQRSDDKLVKAVGI